MISEILDCECRGEEWEPAEDNPWRDHSNDPDWEDMDDTRSCVEDFWCADMNGRAGADDASMSSGGDDSDDDDIADEFDELD